MDLKVQAFEVQKVVWTSQMGRQEYGLVTFEDGTSKEMWLTEFAGLHTLKHYGFVAIH